MRFFKCLKKFLRIISLFTALWNTITLNILCTWLMNLVFWENGYGFRDFRILFFMEGLEFLGVSELFLERE